MQNIEIKNAVITSTRLGREDHGIMTFFLNLDYGGSGQGAGGYCLDSYDKDKKVRVGTVYGLELIMKTMQIVGVEKWEDLPNQNIRVRASHDKVHAIGHFLKDEWLDLKSFLINLGLNTYLQR